MFGPGRLSHLDCQQPRLLSAEERALLSAYCRDHPVGKCIACAGDFKLSELALDVLGFLRYLCPRCRRDLTDSVRTHLYGCAAAGRRAGARGSPDGRTARTRRVRASVRPSLPTRHIAVSSTRIEPMY